MRSQGKPVVAFVLSLLSGVLILVGGFVWWGRLIAGWRLGWMEGMMNDWDSRMHSATVGPWTFGLGLLAMLCAVTVILAAVMLYVNPIQHLLWGALVIVFSVISVASWMGSVGLGLVTGLVGGILAILWKPEETKRS
jgi:hypothetical protein